MGPFRYKLPVINFRTIKITIRFLEQVPWVSTECALFEQTLHMLCRKTDRGLVSHHNYIAVGIPLKWFSIVRPVLNATVPWPGRRGERARTPLVVSRTQPHQWITTRVHGERCTDVNVYIYIYIYIYIIIYIYIYTYIHTTQGRF